MSTKTRRQRKQLSAIIKFPHVNHKQVDYCNDDAITDDGPTVLPLSLTSFITHFNYEVTIIQLAQQFNSHRNPYVSADQINCTARHSTVKCINMVCIPMDAIPILHTYCSNLLGTYSTEFEVASGKDPY